MGDNPKVSHVNEPSHTAWVVHPCQELPELTNLKKAIEQYEKLWSQWREAPCRKELLNVIEQWQSTHPLVIKKAASLAIGKITQPERDKCGKADCRCVRSFNQLVIFMDIVDYVKPANGDFEVISQDPKYSKLDKALLEYLNVRVVKDTAAQLKVDNETLVFAPCWGQDSEIWAQCHHRQPGLYIGNLSVSETQNDKLRKLNDLEPKPKVPLPSGGWAALKLYISSLENFHSTRDIIEWEFRSNCMFCYACGTLGIYWRKSTSAQMEKGNGKGVKKDSDACHCSQYKSVPKSAREFLEFATAHFVSKMNKESVV